MKALILALAMVAFGLSTSVFAEGETAPPANNAPATDQAQPGAPTGNTETAPPAEKPTTPKKGHMKAHAHKKPHKAKKSTKKEEGTAPAEGGQR
jgi:hypothetical protein